MDISREWAKEEREWHRSTWKEETESVLEKEREGKEVTARVERVREIVMERGREGGMKMERNREVGIEREQDGDMEDEGTERQSQMTHLVIHQYTREPIPETRSE